MCQDDALEKENALITKHGWVRNEKWKEYITKGKEVITSNSNGEFFRGDADPAYLGKIDNVRIYPTLEAAILGYVPTTEHRGAPGFKSADCCFYCRHSNHVDGDIWCEKHKFNAAICKYCDDFDEF